VHILPTPTQDHLEPPCDRRRDSHSLASAVTVRYSPHTRSPLCSFSQYRNFLKTKNSKSTLGNVEHVCAVSSCFSPLARVAFSDDGTESWYFTTVKHLCFLEEIRRPCQVSSTAPKVCHRPPVTDRTMSPFTRSSYATIW